MAPGAHDPSAWYPTQAELGWGTRHMALGLYLLKTQLLGDAVQFGLILDDLLQRFVRGVGGNLATVDHEGGHGRDVEILAELDGGFDGRLGFRQRCAGRNFGWIEPGLGGGAVESEGA